MKQQIFPLHSKLEADSFFIKKLSICQCRLMNNATFPWVLLIPEVDGASEWIDLRMSDQIHVLEDLNRAATFLRKQLPCTKLNIAALGNQVPQLHLHVIVRTAKDPAWPHPVWGHPFLKYEEDQKQNFLLLLKQL